MAPKPVGVLAARFEYGFWFVRLAGSGARLQHLPCTVAPIHWWYGSPVFGNYAHFALSQATVVGALTADCALCVTSVLWLPPRQPLIISSLDRAEVHV